MLELAAEGASQREIAETVFGDPRFRGRVERILRLLLPVSDASPLPRSSEKKEEAPGDFRPDSDIALFRELVSRAERAMLESGTAPLLSDIERLLRVKRQLSALEAIERANAIARRRS